MHSKLQSKQSKLQSSRDLLQSLKYTLTKAYDKRHPLSQSEMTSNLRHAG
jgi:hypothetical protein